jgi:hypothetical protein
MTTIRPTPPLKLVSRLHVVLEDEPSELLAFWRDPILPRHLHHEGVYHALESSLIGLRRRVGSQSCELPDVICGAFGYMNLTYPRPKVQSLRDVIICDAKIGVDFLDPIIIVDALVNHGVFRL